MGRGLNLGQAQGLTVLVGGASLAVVLGLRRVAPAVPGSLVAVLLGILAVELLDLEGHGLDIVGHIDSGLPALGVPDVSLHDYGQLVAGGIGVMLVGFAEGLGAAKTYAARHHYEVDPNRELLGLGGANIAAGLSSGMVVNGSLSKTAVNGSAGAMTQLSGLVVAALTIVTLLLLTALFESLPEATLAAVVIAAVIELVDLPALAGYYRIATGRHPGRLSLAARPDFVAAVAAMLGVLVFDTLPGLFIGIACSPLLLLYRASRPHVARLGKVPGSSGQYSDVARHAENERPAGVAVVRPDGGLFFANADAVRRRILEAAADPGVHAVVLDAEAMPFIDVTAAQMLSALREDLGRRHVELLLARDLGAVRDALRASHIEDGTHVFGTVQERSTPLGGRRAGAQSPTQGPRQEP